MWHRITQFGLGNFRIFKEHFDFDLAPITVLTGPNNCGKSSVIKALLLLKENEDVINDEIPSVDKIQYHSGDHNLGSHQHTINTKGLDTVFSFTFFKGYKYCFQIQNDGSVAHDYQIVSGANELVIEQSGGKIRICVPGIIEYLKFWIEYLEEITGGDALFLPEKENLPDIEKLNRLVEELVKLSESIDIIDVNLYDVIELSEDQIKIKLDEYDKHLADRDYKPVLDLESDIVDLNEDSLDINLADSLIYLFHKITKTELSTNDVFFILPTTKKPFFRFEKLIYVPTIKENLKRTYSENDKLVFKSIIQTRLFDRFDWQTSNTIRRSEKKKPKNSSDIREVYFEFIRKWLVEFDIGENLSYGYDDKNDLYYIKIDEKSLLEYGAGYGQIIYLLMSLGNQIDNDLPLSEDRSILFFPVTYVIEEPEINLHPAFQSKLAEMIIDAQKTFGVNFLIETHSEYFIRKLQFMTAKALINPDDSIIYYFNNPNNIPESEEQIIKITIDRNGSLSDSFGPGFIDEATTLKFDLLRLNRDQNN